MPSYIVTGPTGLKLKLTGDTPPSEADIDEAFEAHGNSVPSVVQGANAFSRAAISTLGLPAEGLNLLTNAGEMMTGTPWKDTTKTKDSQFGLGAFGFDALDNAFGENGLNAYKTKDLGTDLNHRMAEGLGGLAGGIMSGGGATGLAGLKTMAKLFGYGAVGQTVGREGVDPLLPDDWKGTGEAAGTLLGLGTGAWRSMKKPAPGKGMTDQWLKDRVAQGEVKARPSPAISTVDEQLDMMNEGGPAGPVREYPASIPGATAAEQEAGTAAQGVLNQLQLLDKAGRGSSARGKQLMAPLIEETTPSWMNRLGYKTGLSSDESAYKTGLFDALTQADKALGGRPSKSLLMRLPSAQLMQFAPRAIRTTAAALRAGRPFLNQLAVDRAGKKASAFKNLETIVRTQKPLPTKGTVVKDALRVGGKEAGRIANRFAEDFGVDQGPGTIMGSGPMLLKPSAMTKLNVKHTSPYDFDEFRFDETTMGKGAGGEVRGEGIYTAENDAVINAYWKPDNDSVGGTFTVQGPQGPVDFYKNQKALAKQFNVSPDAIRDMGWEIKYRGGIPAVIADVKNAIQAWTPWPQRKPNVIETQKLSEFAEKLELLEALKTAGYDHRARTPWTKYDLEVNLPEQSIMDFDAPLSKQPAGVLEGLTRMNTKLWGDARPITSVYANSQQLPAEDAYMTARADLLNQGTKRWDIPKHFRDNGIEATKYADQGSRGLHPGELKTFNYVIQDPKKIKILRKYGITGIAIAGGGIMVPKDEMPEELRAQMEEEDEGR